jgi:predicted short-subunit dehydrogenase-like oxidoreductase (DUF2520 family)
VHALGAHELVEACDLVLLAAPDDALAPLIAALPWRAGQAAVHCSGALGLQVLEPARAAGALCGCMHPLQSFPERFGAPERFHGVVCGVEADGALGARLEALCTQLGARSVRLEGIDRARYHAAAVLASNYVVALHAAAAEAWTLAGLPEGLAREALAPLTQGVAENIGRLPLERALTGPIARGDAATVARQLAALAQRPALQAVYRRLGAALLALPLPLPPERRAALEALLRNGL